MRVLVLLAALGLASAGCGDGADYHGDSRFTAEERAQIQQGADWLMAQVGRPPMVIAWDFDADDGPEPGTIVRAGRGGNAGQCAGGAVYLDPEKWDRYLPGLTAHELAHCSLGMRDAYAGETQSDGIMRVLEPMQWTAVERALCRESPFCPAAGR